MRSITGLVRVLSSDSATDEQKEQAARLLVDAAIEAEVDYRLFDRETHIGYPGISPTATLGNVPGCGEGGYDTLEWEAEHIKKRGQLAQLGEQLLADLPKRALAALLLTAYPTKAPRGGVDTDRQERAPREVTLAWVVEHQFSVALRLGIGECHVSGSGMVMPYKPFPSDKALSVQAGATRTVLMDRLHGLFDECALAAA